VRSKNNNHRISSNEEFLAFYDEFEKFYETLEIDFEELERQIHPLYDYLYRRGRDTKFLEERLELLIYEFFRALNAGGFTPTRDVFNEFYALLNKLRDKYAEEYYSR
jgi:hypothetical protein